MTAYWYNQETSHLFREEICDEFAVSSILDKLVSGNVTIPILVNDALKVLDTGLKQILIPLHLGKPDKEQ